MKGKKLALSIIFIFIFLNFLTGQTVDNAYFLFSKGNEYFKNGDYNTAITYYQKSIPLYEKVYGKNNLYTADNYYLLGTSYYSLGDYDKAILWLKKSLEIYKGKDGDISAACDAIWDLAKATFSINQYDESLKYFKDSILLFNEWKNTNKTEMYLADAYYYSGFCYSQKQNYSSSINNW